MKKLSFLLKRVIDRFMAAAMIVALLPVFIILILTQFIFIGSPIFFVSTRVGYKKTTFKMLKFRSMTNAKDANGHFLPDEERLISYGRFIRKTSLDEVPQIFNVLIGNMSWIGPRAVPQGHLDFIKNEHEKRFDMLPGISGWTQVNYKGKKRTWEEKLALDIEYIENFNLLFDLKIVLMTITVLFTRLRYNKSGSSL